MPKVIVSIDGVVTKEATLLKERTTMGRRPFNDIVIDNLAVSGEHLAFLISGSEVLVEDLNSTNGTYVNGKSVRKVALNHGDLLEVGKYKIEFFNDAQGGVADTIPERRPDAARTSSSQTSSQTSTQAAIRVLSGAAAGREAPLTKVVTTFGKPGVAVAAITRGPQGYVVHHVEGGGNPLLNGAPIGSDPLALKHGDQIELAGTRMQFVLS